MIDNPFEVTKAVDFTDQQIEANWVDLPGGGFTSLADPCSPMPRFLVGGKGGGRTHLLRYFSYSLQCLRYGDDLIRGIQRDGYVGIYFRCGGLNSSRFAGKRQDAYTWAAVFSYYTEVWLGRLAIDLIAKLYSRVESHGDEIRAFVRAVVALFDVDLAYDSNSSNPLMELASAFHSIQRQLDIAINNAALTHQLDIRIGVTPGRLVFGIPAAASEYLPIFSGVVFAYLLDEYENLTLEQQRYVNTLIREKQLPTTFIVGSRRYGLRTHGTLSADEENKQGSEYDLVVLEDTYRAREKQYTQFCHEIVRKRLHEFINIEPKANLDDYFDLPSNEAKTLEERARLYASRREKPGVSLPWLARLEEQLRTSTYRTSVPDLLAQVRFPESPLHEKFAIFLLYRAWADRHDLIESARLNRQGVEQLLTGGMSDKKIVITYNHYRRDLYAQLLDDLEQPQEYSGLDNFVLMSGFLPRNLLVLLKQVTRWSLFLGEKPFQGTKISIKAQYEGIREASTWFLSDAKGLGRVGDETQFAIRRLASLFRDMRFSHKPVEVSCSTFATDLQGLSPSATQVLDEAISHSMILVVPNGRRDKNSQVLHHKYQLNPMLAPMFDLSLARRGSVTFSSEEMNAIFDPEVNESGYNSLRRRLLSRMQAPFTAGSSQASSTTAPTQVPLSFE